MRRGTTPYITIQTDQDLTAYSYVVFTIEDRTGTEIDVDSNSENMQVNPDNVVVKLSQADTLALQKGGVKMQLRAVDTGGNAIASNIMQGNLEDVLKDGVIGG